MNDLILAIDCGTQSLRAILFDRRGTVVAKKKIEYEPYAKGAPGTAEQDPAVYWSALADACKGLEAERPDLMRSVACCAVTAQRDSMICVDENGDALRPAILWLDVRKAKPPFMPGPLVRAALSAAGMGEALLKTQEEGKCNWIMAHEPRIWEKTHKYLQVSGYLNRKLTGVFTDSVASQIGHMPFDYRRQAWSKDGSLNAKLFPVEPAKLPLILPPGEALGAITSWAAAETGIREGTPVIAAGSDKGCETIGMGVVDETMASLSFGTTATVQTTSRRYLEPLTFMPAYPAPIPGAFNPEIEIFRGYWMITWFKNQFAYEEVLEAKRNGMAPEEMLNRLLERTPPGAHGLVMQPYWMPMLKIPSGKGAIIGFGDVHDRAYLYRSIIEGLAYGLREGLTNIERVSKKKVIKLTVSGGASQSDQICKISADVIGLPLVRGKTYETSGLGAAMCAAKGVGMYPSVEAAVGGMCAYDRVFEPERETSELYDKLFTRVYRKMYKALAPLYEEIREITNYPEKVDR